MAGLSHQGGSQAWANDFLPHEYAGATGAARTYAAVPRTNEPTPEEDNEDDAMVFMIGDLYEDEAGSSSALIRSGNGG